MPEVSSPKPTRQKSFQLPLFYFSAALIAGSLVLMGGFAHAVKKSSDDDQFYEFAAMFSEVYKNVKDRYVEDVDSKKLFEGALQGMFMTLDPHSQFMDPDNYNQLEKDTEGAFSGIGIHITLKDGVLTCIAPMPGSPAARAGVKPWDRIIEIDGKKTEGISLIDAVKKLTGPSGTTVKVKIYREGTPSETHEFELVRKNIKVDSVYSKMLDDKIGYARITKFSDNTSRDLRKAIDSFKEKNAKGIVVDLRFNTGGLLKEAVDVSNLFIGNDKLVVSTKGRRKNQNSELRAEAPAATDLPLVVLINKGSASASEIFAGAMKDHKRGVVLGIKGQRSFGKGSVQTIEELKHSFDKDDNGNARPAAIRLTTAKYYLPNGETIDKQGVTPDIAVELPKDAEVELIRHGMIGDPEPEPDDAETTKSTFSWKDQKKDDKTATETAEQKKDPSVTQASGGDADPDSIVGSAIKRDKPTSTTLEPRRIIALDRTLFPDAETEEEAAKKAAEAAKKKKVSKNFVDYQLLVGQRLLHDLIDKGKDFYAPDAGNPPAAPGNKDVAAKAGTASPEATPAASN